MKTTLDELQTFLRIIDAGSITEAALQLGQTTSGVSRTLSRLEQKLGCILLRRTTRRQDLTQEGEAFLLHSRKIIAAFEQAEDAVKPKNLAPTGLLKVDSSAPFILHGVVPFLKEFKELYPGIEIELHTSDQNIDLIEKRIDIALRIGRLEDSSLYATALGTSQRRLLASPEYLAKHGTPKTVEDLSSHHIMCFTAPRRLNIWPVKIDKTNLYTAKAQTRASSGETLLQLALGGMGIVCLSDFMTKPARESGRLVPLLKNATVEMKEEIHAVYYKNMQTSQRAILFTQFLKKKLKTMGI